MGITNNKKHPQLYEINTRVWINQLREQYGIPVSLSTIPNQEWEKIHKLGFDLVWLMGIWEPSPESERISRSLKWLENKCNEIFEQWSWDYVTGSPYAIKNYNVNPALGSMEELGELKKVINQMGMGLILDFVPNHTAVDHPWVRTHVDNYIHYHDHDYTGNVNNDEFFPLGEGCKKVYVAHGRDPYFPSWTDTAQLNYFNPRTRIMMTRILENLAQYCDGVRCDMAMLVLNEIHLSTWKPVLEQTGYEIPGTEFWEECIPFVKEKHPDFIFIAESYWDKEWLLQQLGFDYTYDKKLYDLVLESFGKNVQAYLQSECSYQDKLVRFIENHDETRAITALGREKSIAAAVLVATLPGMRLFHQGQLEGYETSLPVQVSRGVLEPANNDVKEFYARLLGITQVEIFHGNGWRLLETVPVGDSNMSHENLVAYQWRMQDKFKLVVINLSNQRFRGHVKIPGLTRNTGVITFYDELNSQTYEHKIHDVVTWGLYIDLDAYKFHILSANM